MLRSLKASLVSALAIGSLCALSALPASSQAGASPLAASSRSEKFDPEKPASVNNKAPYQLIRPGDTKAVLDRLRSIPLGDKAFNSEEVIKASVPFPVSVKTGVTLKPFATNMFETHDAADHIYIQLEGSQVVLIGGKLVNPKEVSKGHWVSEKAKGYHRVTLRQGDMLFIPRFVPHGGVSKAPNSMMVVTFGDH
ncbi:cupin domain-containing protein [Streptomyces mirabilis]|uniref:cupin domain-containing protein n=1 Tax=Streptomyces mirabilis TaxID=68239 RepID=UPI0036516524